jgi:hypothetical protein
MSQRASDVDRFFGATDEDKKGREIWGVCVGEVHQDPVERGTK